MPHLIGTLIVKGTCPILCVLGIMSIIGGIIGATTTVAWIYQACYIISFTTSAFGCLMGICLHRCYDDQPYLSIEYETSTIQDPEDRTQQIVQSIPHEVIYQGCTLRWIALLVVLLPIIPGFIFVAKYNEHTSNT
jgi:hypothetical protein